jgi:hypothetical protein
LITRAAAFFARDDRDKHMLLELMSHDLAPRHGQLPRL